MLTMSTYGEIVDYILERLINGGWASVDDILKEIGSENQKIIDFMADSNLIEKRHNRIRITDFGSGLIIMEL